MKWRPGLGQWSSIEEPPEWRSVISPEENRAAAAVAEAPRRRPSMFDAFRPAPEEERFASSPRPSMFRAFSPSAPEPERRPPAIRPARPEAPRPSMFAAFRPEESPSGDIWSEMFGEPATRAAAPAAPGLRFQPAMAGSGTEPGKGFSWGMAAVVGGVGAFLLLEAAGVTNVFGTRRSP